MTDKLTERERRFVEAFLGKCAGNGSAAARAAGYRHGHVAASRLLRRVKVQKAIAARVSRREQAAIMTAEERDKLRTVLANDGSVPANVRLKAALDLDRVEGRLARAGHRGIPSYDDLVDETVKPTTLRLVK